MKIKLLFLSLLLVSATSLTSKTLETKTLTLEEINSLIHLNQSVILASQQSDYAKEAHLDTRNRQLPEINATGSSYLSNRIPLASNSDNSTKFLYHFNLASEYDIYAGGKNYFATKLAKTQSERSKIEKEEVKQRILLECYILLYDIYRNNKYKEFIEHSIELRKREYARIENLYHNGTVLKSDLLRSNLYITDLEKDKAYVVNSINILSEQMCVKLGIEQQYLIIPDLDDDMKYTLETTFEALYNNAKINSLELMIQQYGIDESKIQLKETKSAQLPNIKLYANYGVGSAQPYFDFRHQLGGEVGAKISWSLASLYKSKHTIKRQEKRIDQANTMYQQELDRLRSKMYELSNRYNESQINIKRASAKIELSRESYRILNNSYFNQQALLIDVLESETQIMKASFEWVEAMVDSQKYYWAIQQISGELKTNKTEK